VSRVDGEALADYALKPNFLATTLLCQMTQTKTENTVFIPVYWALTVQKLYWKRALMYL